ncbi:hypothetical protein FRC08_000521 [Ceratobasidium sp. 394]|nr:hypothetical protein FRC08_000521 [Ceratobasidium sp. 394]
MDITIETNPGTHLMIHPLAQLRLSCGLCMRNRGTFCVGWDIRSEINAALTGLLSSPRFAPKLNNVFADSSLSRGPLLVALVSSSCAIDLVLSPCILKHRLESRVNVASILEGRTALRCHEPMFLS